MTELAITPSPQEVPRAGALPDDSLRTTLDCLAIGEMRTVREVRAPADTPEWTQLLEEIGFIAGENVTLMARGMPGGDPLVVRVGMSTFALRRAEAACVQVARD